MLRRKGSGFASGETHGAYRELPRPRGARLDKSRVEDQLHEGAALAEPNLALNAAAPAAHEALSPQGQTVAPARLQFKIAPARRRFSALTGFFKSTTCLSRMVDWPRQEARDIDTSCYDGFPANSLWLSRFWHEADKIYPRPSPRH